ncbi:hypothetical protein Dcar01_01664 [Deinococcus carri]|uniref:Uncharacterized protein n=1 Tax=Deinococcus carri TaxID=1211323 RepID=A0ABP9W6E8_9DEIO
MLVALLICPVMFILVLVEVVGIVGWAGLAVLCAKAGVSSRATIRGRQKRLFMVFLRLKDRRPS